MVLAGLTHSGFIKLSNTLPADTGFNQLYFLRLVILVFVFSRDYCWIIKGQKDAAVKGSKGSVK